MHIFRGLSIFFCFLVTSCSSLVEVGDLVDRNGPVILVAPLPTYTNTASFTLNFRVTDCLSGVKVVFYRIDSGSIQFFFTNNAIPVSGFTDGFHQMELWAMDSNDHFSVTQKIQTIVDTTPPAVEITSPLDGLIQGSTNLPVSVLATDRGSGVKDVWASVNGTAYVRLTGGSHFTGDFTIPFGQPCDIRVYGVDNVGNVSSTQMNSISCSTNIGSNLVFVRGGSFTAGSDLAWLQEPAVHNVNLDDYYIDKYETTFAEWDAYVSASFGAWSPDDNGWGRGQRPVMNVSWMDAIAYCNWKSIQEGLPPAYDTNTGNLILINSGITNIATNSRDVKGYRLPTEAEWEYAARGKGIRSEDQFSGSDIIDTVGWYNGNSGDSTQIVGQKSSNELGIYDMSGNVAEWCQDWYAEYPSISVTDPLGPQAGTNKVFRGGSYLWDSDLSWIGVRLSIAPDSRVLYIGLRLARSE